MAQQQPGRSELDDDELARIRNREIGFVFQTFNLLARATALHNVELPLIYSGTPSDERIARAKAALEAVDLGERMNHKPNELSGGQRQRVFISFSAGNNPSIILADEPPATLDSQTGNEIMKLMEDLHRRAILLCWSPMRPISPSTLIASCISVTASSPATNAGAESRRRSNALS